MTPYSSTQTPKTSCTRWSLPGKGTAFTANSGGPGLTGFHREPVRSRGQWLSVTPVAAAMLTIPAASRLTRPESRIAGGSLCHYGPGQCHGEP
jgi:hypothetical protein